MESSGALKKYIVQTTDVATNAFSDLSGTIAASDSSTSYTNVNPAVAVRLYRVKLVYP